MTIGVVVADDQQLVRSGFAMILAAQPDIDVLAEVSDGAEAVEAVRRHRPDVALLDVRMPNVDGIEAAKVICAETSCHVLMLTTYDVDSYVYGALYAGASGFVLKDIRRGELVDAVRTVAAGEALLAPTATRRVIEEFTRRVPQDLHEIRSAGPEVLTTREVEILRLLARGRSNSQIADELVVSGHTVKTHVSSVLGKLGLRDRVQAVIYAYESGLVTPGTS